LDLRRRCAAERGFVCCYTMGSAAKSSVSLSWVWQTRKRSHFTGAAGFDRHMGFGFETWHGRSFGSSDLRGGGAPWRSFRNN